MADGISQTAGAGSAAGSPYEKGRLGKIRAGAKKRLAQQGDACAAGISGGRVEALRQGDRVGDDCDGLCFEAASCRLDRRTHVFKSRLRRLEAPPRHKAVRD